jgi:hypothetical protein
MINPKSAFLVFDCDAHPALILEQPVTGFQVASVHSIEEPSAMLATEPFHVF